jgi:hypothetical protein
VKFPRCFPLAAGSLLGVKSAQAQDALRSALSLQPVISPSQTAPAVDLRPERPHLGPVQLTLGAYTSLELNDNIGNSQFNPQSDLLIRGGLNLGVIWPATLQSELRFSSSIGYLHYVKNSFNDHLEVAPTSALSWAIRFDDGAITLFDQFSYSQQVLSESALSGIAIFPWFNNTIGTRVDWLPGHWAVQAGYSHNNSLSDSSQFQYLNAASEYLFARGGWRFAENTQAGLETSYSISRYQSATQADNSNVSLGPYAEWQVTDSLRASLRGGPVFYFFDPTSSSSSGRQLNSYYFGLNVADQLTDFLSQGLNIQRTVRQGLNKGSPFIEELTASYSVVFSLTQRVSLSASFAYDHGKQPYEVPVYIPPFGTFLVESTENFDRYGATFNASWRATEHLSASMAFNHWLRQSNIQGNGYTVNSLSFSLGYTF